MRLGDEPVDDGRVAGRALPGQPLMADFAAHRRAVAGALIWLRAVVLRWVMLVEIGDGGGDSSFGRGCGSVMARSVTAGLPGVGRLGTC